MLLVDLMLPVQSKEICGVTQMCRIIKKRRNALFQTTASSRLSKLMSRRGRLDDSCQVLYAGRRDEGWKEREKGGG